MMKISGAYFLKSAMKAADFPDLRNPEFAFLGRSNVGKSSLINMISGVRGLVKVGSSPGVTRTINFFILNGSITIADLPGFGYAKVRMELRRAFLPLIKTYIAARDQLRVAFMLIDIRRVPDDYEKDIITLLSERSVPVAIIATKCDKLSRGERRARAGKIAEALEIDPGSIFFSSTRTGEGRKEILGLIHEYGGR